VPPPHPLPLEPEPWRQRVGTRTLDPDTWIELGPDADEQITLKRRILAERADEVVVVLPGTEPAAAELLDELTAHLLRLFPGRYARDRGGSLVDPRDGSAYLPDDPDRLHPLDAAGRLVPEDLCLHLPGPDGVLRLVGGSVAFPSRWRLADKVGLPVGAVHAPVPRYAEIAPAVDRLLAGLTPGRGLWRLGWTVHQDAALSQPPGPEPAAAPAADFGTAVAGGAWLRMERQTLRRLPRHGSVVFTIRTSVTPLADVARDPQARSRLVAALRAMPEEIATYKDLPAQVRARPGRSAGSGRARRAARSRRHHAQWWIDDVGYL
jgi:hypothetical protein